MIIRTRIRSYAGAQLISQEYQQIDSANIDKAACKMIEKHSAMLLRYPQFLIEVEFLDEPDVNQRFFRIGNSPVGMIDPRRLY